MFFPVMEMTTLTLSDETLRDGQQQVGLFFPPDFKQALAHRIAQTGVHQIAMMPAIHPTEGDLMKRLVADGLGQQLTASTLMTQESIDQSRACGVQQIILFHAVSDRLLFLRDPVINRDWRDRPPTIDEGISPTLIQEMRQRMLEKVLAHLRYAQSCGLRVCFAAEDASRTDFQFLVECITAVRPYVDQVLLCDTVGALTPEKTYVWIHDLLECTDQAPLSVHFHNDMGLALENTIQAVLAGASGVSGTFGGIGERAGNVALEQVLRGLRLRFGWEVAGIDYAALDAVTQFLDRHHIRAHAPYSAPTQRHETGIHVSSMLRDRQSYCIFPYSEPEIWFGRCSGASNFQYLFEEKLGRSLSREAYEQLRSAVKALAIEHQRSFSAEEILTFLDQGILLMP